MRRPRFTLARLFMVVAGVVVLLAIARGSLSILDKASRRVHPSEQHIADHIRGLGGTYRAVGKDNWHITIAWLPDTATTDQDLELVLQLDYLFFLNVAGTHVSDASLDRIFAHKAIRGLRVSGSRISRSALREAFAKSGERIRLDE